MTRERVWLNSTEQYNSVRLTFLLNSILNRRISTLNSRQAIFDCPPWSWEGRGRLSSRRSAKEVELLRAPPTLTLAACVVWRQPQDHVLFYWRNVTTTRCRQLRAVATPRLSQHVVDATLSLTSRIRHRAAVFHISPTTLTPRREPSLRLLPARPLQLTAGLLAAGLRCIYFNSKIVVYFCCVVSPPRTINLQ